MKDREDEAQEMLKQVAAVQAASREEGMEMEPFETICLGCGAIVLGKRIAMAPVSKVFTCSECEGGSKR